MTTASYPRRFVDPAAKLESWDEIEPYFDKLRDREIDTVEKIEPWLIDCSELLACIDEVGTDRYVKMTCQTDDEARSQAYLDFIEHIEPGVKPRSHELNVKYTKSPAAAKLPQDRYAVLDRSIRAQVSLFRQENVAIQVEEAKLEQEFQQISGAQTVQFEGEEQTLQQLARYAERTDRDIRRRAWEAESDRRLEDADKLDAIFDKLVELRHQMALNADCVDYREYAFKAKERFDYTPEDCRAFHDAVEKAAVPALRAMLEDRKRRLGVEPLRPWDVAVDLEGRPPLAPFETVDQLCDGVSRIFHRVHSQFGQWFDEMRERKCLDLDSRKGKAPGGYQSTYEERRQPFIFMNAVGLQGDVGTMLHEGGHAFHTFAARHDPFLAYRSSPIEFAEVASFGMELLTFDCLDEFYKGDDLARAQRTQLEGIISLFPWVATIDAFQHFIYTHPQHTHDERRACWLSLRERFGGIADYTGYEQALAAAWHRQLHLFQVPFYYIEYGIAKLGALQVWRSAMTDRAGAIQKYRTALALGGSRPLPELFETAGAKFDFSEKTLTPLIAAIREKLDTLPA